MGKRNKIPVNNLHISEKNQQVNFQVPAKTVLRGYKYRIKHTH